MNTRAAVRRSFGTLDFRFMMLVFSHCAAIHACAFIATAQEGAKEYIEPRINRTQFTLMYRQLGLDSDQRMIVESMFSDYSGRLDELARDLDEKATQAGLRSVQDAMSGKTRLTPDELRAKRVAVLRVYQQGWPVIDKAWDDLVDGVEMVLLDEQAVHFEPALRELRRSVFLHPRQAESDYQEYAGDGVDILLLVENAMKDGGEFQRLTAGALQSVLNSYELQLDALLMNSAKDYRTGKLLRKIAGIEKDAAAARDLDRLALQRWKQLFELNTNAVQQIAKIAGDNLGEQARQQWLDRFDQASFTWLYPRRTPDRQIEWMRQQSLPTDVREQTETVYENYLTRRRELSRNAIEIMLRGRLELQTMLYSMMDATRIEGTPGRPLFDQLLKNSGEQANLDNTTAGMLESLLNPSQRDAMRKAMQRPEPGRRR